MLFSIIKLSKFIQVINEKQVYEFRNTAEIKSVFSDSSYLSLEGKFFLGYNNAKKDSKNHYCITQW